MAQERVGMPTMNSVKDSMIDFGVGLGGGIIYALSAGLFGSGLIGGLLGAGLAGSVIKGTRGTAIATILGFQTIVGASQGQARTSSASGEVM